MAVVKQSKRGVWILADSLKWLSLRVNLFVEWVSLVPSTSALLTQTLQHTPMREMAEKYHTVLVMGGEGEKCRLVAEGYGFKDVITPGDIIKDNRHTTPFRKLTEEEEKHSRARNFAEVEIEAIFVFADSRDWAGDQQILLDLLTSKKGRIGTRSEKYNEGPPIFFSHNDMVWATSHESTRLGMGALRVSLEAMYKAVTGKDLKSTAFGKPQIGTFQFATRLLQQWRKDTHGINSPPETVYFVGDTPESDIRGTNEYNESELCHNSWYSILVETGVYQKGTKPRFEPKATVPNVLDAVNYGIEREMRKMAHRRALEPKFLGSETAVIEEDEEKQLLRAQIVQQTELIENLKRQLELRS